MDLVGLKKIEKDNRIKEAIMRTVAFFDMFDYPLTTFEIWQYSSVECELVEIQNILNTHILSLFIQEKHGFYFLSGRSGIIDKRLKRYNITSKKFKRAILAAKIFKIIPWINMIAVSNIIGANNLKEESDIDLFIITKDKRIWITRFFCVLIIKILGLRPTSHKTRNKICLNFYISENALNLKDLMMRFSEGCDIYFIYWVANLISIYNPGNIYDKFIQSNLWLKGYLPNWKPIKLVKQRDAGRVFSSLFYDIIDLLIGGLDQYLKKIQLRIMPKNLKEIMNMDTRVVVNNNVIKLHTLDRRKEYKNKFYEKNEYYN